MPPGEGRGLSPSPRSRAPPPPCGRSSRRAAARRRERGAAAPARSPAGRPPRCPWPGRRRPAALRSAAAGALTAGTAPHRGGACSRSRCQARGSARAVSAARRPYFVSPWRWGACRLLLGKPRISRFSSNRAALEVFLWVLSYVSSRARPASGSREKALAPLPTAWPASFSPSKIPNRQSSSYPLSFLNRFTHTQKNTAQVLTSAYKAEFYKTEVLRVLRSWGRACWLLCSWVSPALFPLKVLGF